MIRSRSKYGAIKTTVGAHTFDSRAEAAEYSRLLLLERAGKIRGLEIQPAFPIVIDGAPVRIRNKKGHGRKVVAKMDFAYFDLETARRVILDVKGMDTPISRLKRALVEAIYGVEITVRKTS